MLILKTNNKKKVQSVKKSFFIRQAIYCERLESIKDESSTTDWSEAVNVEIGQVRVGPVHEEFHTVVLNLKLHFDTNYYRLKKSKKHDTMRIQERKKGGGESC